MGNINRIESELGTLNEEYMNKIEGLALKEFNKVIVPFLKKRNWTLFVGNGSWFFENKKEESLFADDYEEDQEFQEIEGIFSMVIEGTRYSLGEFMPNFKNK